MAAFDSATLLPVSASLLVALLASLMAYMGYKSFQATENARLPFVILAFIIFAVKSIFVASALANHNVAPHDTIELVSSLFDLVIVLLLFVPFILPAPGRR
ncbi:MAG: hypothetical protein ACPGQL_08155 [Thermoplasmatota archaeon]